MNTTGIATLISFGVGMVLYKSIFGEDVGIIESGIVGGISAAIGGVATVLYQRYFGKYNEKMTEIIWYILSFIMFCIPGAIIGVILAEYVGGDPWTTISVMAVISTLLTIRKFKKIKKKEALLETEISDDLH